MELLALDPAMLSKPSLLFLPSASNYVHLNCDTIIVLVMISSTEEMGIFRGMSLELLVNISQNISLKHKMGLALTKFAVAPSS